MSEYEKKAPSLDELDDEATRQPYRRPSRLLRRVGQGIKWFFVALTAAVFFIMIWRIQTMEQLPRDIRTLSVNEATYQAYGRAEREGKQLAMYTQGKIDPVTTNKEAYGYFWIADSVIIPDAQQLQLVVQYNNSTLEHLASDYRLPAVPDRTEEVLAVRLRVIRDLTPHDPSDNEDAQAQATQTILPAGAPTAEQKDVYNYRRYVFDEVIVDEDVIGVVLEFYYAGDAEAQAPLGELYVYYEQAENQAVKLTKADRAALQSYAEGGF
jgi:hypothetical protein